MTFDRPRNHPGAPVLSPVAEICNRIKRCTILCVGDVMLDEYVYGNVSRVSPEAPALILSADRANRHIGGCGNVASNIARMGAQCILVGVVGADAAGEYVLSEFRKTSQIDSRIVVDATRPTTQKRRYVANCFSTHLLRADWEDTRPCDAEIEQAVMNLVLSVLSSVDVVLLSDYDKGVLTERTIQIIANAARSAGKFVIVDPKKSKFAAYRGAHVLLPNRKELMDAVRCPLSSLSELQAAAQEAIRLSGCDSVLVKRSEDGMALVDAKGLVHAVAGHLVSVRDVSGAGDTVAAAVSCLYAAGYDWKSILELANACGAVAVSSPGTSAIGFDDLERDKGILGELLPENCLHYSTISPIADGAPVELGRAWSLSVGENSFSG